VSRSGALVLCFALIFSTACAEDDDALQPVEIAQVCTGIAELGAAGDSFRPLEDGDAVTLQGLPNGLWLILYTARASGMGPEATACVRQTLADTGEQFGISCWRLPWTDTGDGWLERPGLWGEIDESWEPRVDRLYGKDAIIELEVTAPDGCRVTDSRLVTIE
jgi:hypothetical protein